MRHKMTESGISYFEENWKDARHSAQALKGGQIEHLLAAMVHVPPVTIVTVATLTVHTAVVVEMKATVKPDDAVALTAKGAAP